MYTASEKLLAVCKALLAASSEANVNANPSQRVPCMLQDDPEPTKAKLEKFLESKGIPYKYGTKTKFANFKQRTLD